MGLILIAIVTECDGDSGDHCRSVGTCDQVGNMQLWKEELTQQMGVLNVYTGRYNKRLDITGEPERVIPDMMEDFFTLVVVLVDKINLMCNFVIMEK